MLSNGSIQFAYDGRSNTYRLTGGGTGLLDCHWGLRLPDGRLLRASDYPPAAVVPIPQTGPALRVTCRRRGRPTLHLTVRLSPSGPMAWLSAAADVSAEHFLLLSGRFAGLDRPLAFADGWQSWEPGRTLPLRGARLGHQIGMVVDGHRWHAILAGFPTARTGRGTVSLKPGRLDAEGPEPLVICLGASAPAALEAFAEVQATVNGAAANASPPIGWCSWYAHAEKVTEEDVIRAADLLSRKLPFVRVVQVDDGYQKDHGGHPHGGAGDWHEANAKFPHGLAWLADRIHARGLQAGLWLAPFLVAPDSFFLREFPEALLDTDEPAYIRQNRCRIVDGSHPASREWFTALGRHLTQDLGFDYLKLDYLYFGATGGVAAYRKGMQSLRAGTGDAFILGCGATLVPSIGLVDGMRIGADVGPRFSEPYGVQAGIAGVQARACTHRRLWIADPDCLLLAAPLSRDALLAHVTAVGMVGGSVMLGDDPRDLQRLDLLQRILPPHPYFVRSLPGLVWFEVERPFGRWTVLAVFNEGPLAVRRRIETSVLEKGAWHLFDFWQERYLGRAAAAFTVRVPPQGCRLLSLRGIQDDRPVLVGTSSHISMGGLDVDRFDVRNGELEVVARGPVWIAAPRLEGAQGVAPGVWKLDGTSPTMARWSL